MTLFNKPIPLLLLIAILVGFGMCCCKKNEAAKCEREANDEEDVVAFGLEPHWLTHKKSKMNSPDEFKVTTRIGRRALEDCVDSVSPNTTAFEINNITVNLSPATSDEHYYTIVRQAILSTIEQSQSHTNHSYNKTYPETQYQLQYKGCHSLVINTERLEKSPKSVSSLCVKVELQPRYIKNVEVTVCSGCYESCGKGEEMVEEFNGSPGLLRTKMALHPPMQKALDCLYLKPKYTTNKNEARVFFEFHRNEDENGHEAAKKSCEAKAGPNGVGTLIYQYNKFQEAANITQKNDNECLVAVKNDQKPPITELFLVFRETPTNDLKAGFTDCTGGTEPEQSNRRVKSINGSFVWLCWKSES